MILNPKEIKGMALFGQPMPFCKMFKENLMDYITEAYTEVLR